MVARSVGSVPGRTLPTTARACSGPLLSSLLHRTVPVGCIAFTLIVESAAAADALAHGGLVILLGPGFDGLDFFLSPGQVITSRHRRATSRRTGYRAERNV